MIRFIDHIVEPERLQLSWQPPAGMPDRLRRFVGELVRRDGDADLRYLRDSEDFKIARNNGFIEYPGFPIEEDHPRALAAFMRRLPPRKRGDFGRYLESIRIRPGTAISDLALLGYSGAKLPDDDFTFVHPFDTAVPPFELLATVQGYRYYMDRLPFESLALGMEARLECESDNPYDPEAVAVLIRGIKCGYVCRGLSGQFRKWMRAGYRITANIERLNGTPEKPLIYLFVEVRGAEGTPSEVVP